LDYKQLRSDLLQALYVDDVDVDVAEAQYKCLSYSCSYSLNRFRREQHRLSKIQNNCQLFIYYAPS